MTRCRDGLRSANNRTAQEIAALDLSTVQLAVLSACETGTGAIRSGEGVFGLRRAFRMAGSRALVASLWSIEDAAALEWMREFYDALLGNGLEPGAAVRAASLHVLEGRRERGESTLPFYWAAFVASDG